jgi:hypothetical protein
MLTEPLDGATSNDADDEVELAKFGSPWYVAATEATLKDAPAAGAGGV